VFVPIRYHTEKHEASGKVKLTPGNVQAKGKAAGLMVVYRYEGGKRVRHEFFTVKMVGEKPKMDEHVELYDLAVDPVTGIVADWPESVAQYVDPRVPAPAAE
jgi:hypothetical protein